VNDDRTLPFTGGSIANNRKELIKEPHTYFPYLSMFAVPAGSPALRRVNSSRTTRTLPRIRLFVSACCGGVILGKNMRHPYSR
jgi:hypothetical protein